MAHKKEIQIDIVGNVDGFIGSLDKIGESFYDTTEKLNSQVSKLAEDTGKTIEQVNEESETTGLSNIHFNSIVESANMLSGTMKNMPQTIRSSFSQISGIVNESAKEMSKSMSYLSGNIEKVTLKDYSRIVNNFKYQTQLMQSAINDAKSAAHIFSLMDQGTKDVLTSNNGSAQKFISTRINNAAKSYASSHEGFIPDDKLFAKEVLKQRSSYAELYGALLQSGISDQREQEKTIQFLLKTNGQLELRNEFVKGIQKSVDHKMQNVFVTDTVPDRYKASYWGAGKVYNVSAMPKQKNIDDSAADQQKNSFFNSIVSEIQRGNYVALNNAVKARLAVLENGTIRFAKQESVTNDMLDYFGALNAKEAYHAVASMPMWYRNPRDPKNEAAILSKQNKRQQQAYTLMRADVRDRSNPYFRTDIGPKKFNVIYDDSGEAISLGKLNLPEMIQIPRMTVNNEGKFVVKRKNESGGYVYSPDLNFGWNKVGVTENIDDEWITQGQNPILEKVIKLHNGASFQDRSFGYGFYDSGDKRDQAKEGVPLLINMSLEDLFAKQSNGKISYIDGDGKQRQALMTDENQELIEKLISGEIKPRLTYNGEEIEYRAVGTKLKGGSSLTFMQNKDYEALEKEADNLGIPSLLKYYNEFIDGKLMKSNGKASEDAKDYARMYDAINKGFSHSVSIKELGANSDLPKTAIANFEAFYKAYNIDKAHQFDGGAWYLPSFFGGETFQARMGPAKFLAQRQNWKQYLKDAGFAYQENGKDTFYMPGMNVSSEEYKEFIEQQKEYMQWLNQGKSYVASNSKYDMNDEKIRNAFVRNRNAKYVNIMDESIDMVLADSALKNTMKLQTVTADRMKALIQSTDASVQGDAFSILQKKNEIDKYIESRKDKDTGMIELTADEQSALFNRFAIHGQGLRAMKNADNYLGEKGFWSPAFLRSIDVTDAMVEASHTNYAKAIRELKTPNGIIKRMFSGNDADSEAVKQDPSLIFTDKRLRSLIANERAQLYNAQASGYLYFPKSPAVMSLAESNLADVFDPIGEKYTGIDASKSKDTAVKGLHVDKGNVISASQNRGKRVFTRSPYAPGASYIAEILFGKEQEAAMERYGLSKSSSFIKIEDLFKLNDGDYDGDTLWSYQNPIRNNNKWEELILRRNAAVEKYKNDAEKQLAAEEAFGEKVTKTSLTGKRAQPDSAVGILLRSADSQNGIGLGYKLGQIYGSVSDEIDGYIDYIGNDLYSKAIDSTKKVLTIPTLSFEASKAARKGQAFNRLYDKLDSAAENERYDGIDILQYALPTTFDKLGKQSMLAAAIGYEDEGEMFQRERIHALEEISKKQFSEDKNENVRKIGALVTSMWKGKISGAYGLTTRDEIAELDALSSNLEKEITTYEANGADKERITYLRHIVSRAKDIAETEAKHGFSTSNVSGIKIAGMRLLTKNQREYEEAAINAEIANREMLEEQQRQKVLAEINQENKVAPTRKNNGILESRLLALNRYAAFNWSDSNPWIHGEHTVGQGFWHGYNSATEEQKNNKQNITMDFDKEYFGGEDSRKKIALKELTGQSEQTGAMIIGSAMHAAIEAYQENRYGKANNESGQDIDTGHDASKKIAFSAFVDYLLSDQVQEDAKSAKLSFKKSDYNNGIEVMSSESGKTDTTFQGRIDNLIGKDGTGKNSKLAELFDELLNFEDEDIPEEYMIEGLWYKDGKRVSQNNNGLNGIHYTPRELSDFKRIRKDGTRTDVGFYFTPDAMMKQNDGTYAMFDWKSGQAGAKEAQFQMAFYAHVLEQKALEAHGLNGGIDNPNSPFYNLIKMNEDGSYKSMISKLKSVNVLGGLNDKILELDYNKDIGDYIYNLVVEAQKEKIGDMASGYSNLVDERIRGETDKSKRKINKNRPVLNPNEKEENYEDIPIDAADQVIAMNAAIQLANKLATQQQKQDIADAVKNTHTIQFDDKAFLLQRYNEEVSQLNDASSTYWKKNSYIRDIVRTPKSEFESEIDKLEKTFKGDPKLEEAMKKYLEDDLRNPDVDLLKSKMTEEQQKALELIKGFKELAQYNANEIIGEESDLSFEGMLFNGKNQDAAYMIRNGVLQRDKLKQELLFAAKTRGFIDERGNWKTEERDYYPEGLDESTASETEKAHAQAQANLAKQTQSKYSEKEKNIDQKYDIYLKHLKQKSEYEIAKETLEVSNLTGRRIDGGKYDIEQEMKKIEAAEIVDKKIYELKEMSSKLDRDLNATDEHNNRLLKTGSDEYETINFKKNSIDKMIHDLEENREKAIENILNKNNTFDVGKITQNTIASDISSVTNYINRMITNLFRSMLNGIMNTVKSFNSQITQIQMITTKSDTQMTSVSDSILSKAKEMKVSVSDVASTEASLYRQGLSDSEVSDRTDAILKFSTVSGAKVTEATKAITVALQNGLVQSAEEAMDALVALGDSAATTADEIFKAMQKCANSASQAGVSYAELTSLITLAESKTQISGTQVGTAFQAIFTRMQRMSSSNIVTDQNGEVTYVNDAEKALKSAGVALREDNGTFRDTYDVLLDLSKVWETLSDIQKSAITSSIAGTRQANVFSTLMDAMGEDGGKTLEEYIDLSSNSEGITQTKYEIAITSINAALTSLKTTWDSLVISMTDSGFLTGIIGTAENFLDLISGIVDKIGSIPVLLAGIATALSGSILKNIISGGILKYFTKEIAGKAVTSALGTVIAGPIGTVIGALIPVLISGIIGSITSATKGVSKQELYEKAQNNNTNVSDSYNKQYGEVASSFDIIDDALEKYNDGTDKAAINSEEFANALKTVDTALDTNLQSSIDKTTDGIENLNAELKDAKELYEQINNYGISASARTIGNVVSTGLEAWKENYESENGSISIKSLHDVYTPSANSYTENWAEADLALGKNLLFNFNNALGGPISSANFRDTVNADDFVNVAKSIISNPYYYQMLLNSGEISFEEDTGISNQRGIDVLKDLNAISGDDEAIAKYFKNNKDIAPFFLKLMEYYLQERNENALEYDYSDAMSVIDSAFNSDENSPALSFITSESAKENLGNSFLQYLIDTDKIKNKSDLFANYLNGDITADQIGNLVTTYIGYLNDKYKDNPEQANYDLSDIEEFKYKILDANGNSFAFESIENLPSQKVLNNNGINLDSEYFDKDGNLILDKVKSMIYYNSDENKRVYRNADEILQNWTVSSEDKGYSNALINIANGLKDGSYNGKTTSLTDYLGYDASDFENALNQYTDIGQMLQSWQNGQLNSTLSNYSTDDIWSSIYSQIMGEDLYSTLFEQISLRNKYAEANNILSGAKSGQYSDITSMLSTLGISEEEYYGSTTDQQKAWIQLYENYIENMRSDLRKTYQDQVDKLIPQEWMNGQDIDFEAKEVLTKDSIDSLTGITEEAKTVYKNLIEQGAILTTYWDESAKSMKINVELGNAITEYAEANPLKDYSKSYTSKDLAKATSQIYSKFKTNGGDIDKATEGIDEEELEKIKSYSSELSEYLHLTEEQRESQYAQNLETKINVQILTEGLDDLEYAQKIMSGTTDELEAMAKGGLEAANAINSLGAKFEDTAKVIETYNTITNGGKASSEDIETMKSALGINDSQFIQMVNGQLNLDSNVQQMEEQIINTANEAAKIVASEEVSIPSLPVKYKTNSGLIASINKDTTVTRINPEKANSIFSGNTVSYDDSGNAVIDTNASIPTMREYRAAANVELSDKDYSDVYLDLYNKVKDEEINSVTAIDDVLDNMLTKGTDAEKAVAKFIGEDSEFINLRTNSEFLQYLYDKSNIGTYDETLGIQMSDDKINNILNAMYNGENEIIQGYMTNGDYANALSYLEQMVPEFTTLLQSVAQNIDLEDYQIALLDAGKAYAEMLEKETRKEVESGTAENIQTLIGGTYDEKQSVIGDYQSRLSQASQMQTILTNAQGRGYFTQNQKQLIANYLGKDSEWVKNFDFAFDEVSDLLKQKSKTLTDSLTAVMEGLDIGDLNELNDAIANETDEVHKMILTALKNMFTITNTEYTEAGMDVGENTVTQEGILGSLETSGGYTESRQRKQAMYAVQGAIAQSESAEELFPNLIATGLTEDEIVSGLIDIGVGEIISAEYSENYNKFMEMHGQPDEYAQYQTHSMDQSTFDIVKLKSEKAMPYNPLYSNDDEIIAARESQMDNYFGEDWRTGFADMDEKGLSLFNDFMASDETEFADWISQFTEAQNLLQEISENGKASAESIDKFSDALYIASIAESDFGGYGEEVADIVKKLTGDYEDQSEALKDLNTSATKISKNQYYRNKYKNGARDSTTVGVMSDITGKSEEFLKKQSKELPTDLEQEIDITYKADMQELETNVDALLTSIGADLQSIASETLGQYGINLGDIFTISFENGEFNGSEAIANLLSSLNAELWNAFLAYAQSVELTASISTKVVDNEDGTGTVLMDLNKPNVTGFGGGNYTPKSSGGGGGGGSKKTTTDKILENYEQSQKSVDHKIKQLQNREEYYDQNYEYKNEIAMVDEEISGQNEKKDLLENKLSTLQQRLNSGKVKEGSKEWVTLTDAIRETHEEISETINEIDSLEDKIKELENKIRELAATVAEDLKNMYEDIEEQEEEQLDARVSLSDTILNVLKEQYQEEADLRKKDLENQKEALQEEIDLIDEKLQKRKDAQDESEKLEELEELRTQRSLIAADPTRTSDVKEIDEKIADLEKELYWDDAEKIAEAEKEVLTDRQEAIDDTIELIDEDTELYLENAQNFANKVEEILGGTSDEIIAWLKENDTEYANSLTSVQEQMAQSWQDTWDIMAGSANKYLELINSIIDGTELSEEEIEKMINLWKQTSEYKDMTDAERDAKEAELREEYSNYNSSLNTDIQPEKETYEWQDFLAQKREDLVESGTKFKNNDAWKKYIKNNFSSLYEEYADNEDVNTESALDIQLEQGIYKDVDKQADLINFLSDLGYSVSYSVNTKTGLFNLTSKKGKNRKAIQNLNKQIGKTTDLAKYDETTYSLLYKIASDDSNAYSSNDMIVKIYEALHDDNGDLNIPKYKKGGLVDFTGLTWVDGSLTQPEAFLSAEDTQTIRSMLDAANSFSFKTYISDVSDNLKSGVQQTIGDVTININEASISDDMDIQKLAEQVGNAFVKELSKQGISTANYSF